MTEREFKLPILATLKAALNDISSNAAQLFKALILPAGLLVFLQVVDVIIFRQYMADFTGSMTNDKGVVQLIAYYSLQTLGVSIVQGVFAVIFAVTCHRVILLGGTALPNKAGFYFTTRELKYYGWLILFSIPVVIGIFTLSMLMGSIDPKASSDFRILFEVYIYMGVIIGAFITAKFGFVLPSTAVEDGLSFKECRQLTSGNLLPLTIILATPPTAMYIVGLLLGLTFQETENIAYEIFTGLGLSVFIVFEVIVLSVSYRIIRSIKNLTD